MNVLLFTTSGLASRPEGKTLIIGYDYLSFQSQIEENLQNLLNLMKGTDTDDDYPYVYLNIKEGQLVSGYFDTYREYYNQTDELNFRGWYIEIITTWMSSNGLTIIAVKQDDPEGKYEVKINCDVKV